MPDQNGEKSQDPTPHRRQEARKQGQVARSQDLGSALLLVVALLVLLMFGGQVVDFLAGYTRRHLGGEPWLRADADFVVAQWNSTLSDLAGCLLPVLGLILLAGVAAHMAQVGILFVPDRLAPDLSRIDPLKGLGRMFSLSSLARLAFGIFKILVIAGVTFACLYNEYDTILGLTAMDVPQIAKYLIEILLWTSLKIGLALLVLALVDYTFQRWKHEQDLKMTPQEIREEMKNLEGNPQVIARRRAVQRQLAMSRLSSAVPKADVVITNPTELAVAIRYEPAEMAAPIVVAKGAGLIAQRIRKLALENGIPVVEKKPLAQALYREVEIDRPIPHDKYAAVAEVLAYVYQLKGKNIPGAPGAAA
jgi:flagellar biosynthetic protein FlhB